ncbi:MAG TPA: hypothetical protein VF334_11040 [Polyangia bacterium]
MRALALVATLVALTACTSRRTIGQPNLSVVDATIELRRKVDILFMIDDSPSTAPKQNELVDRAAILIQRIDDLASVGKTASFHIGVVDSDLGAGPYTLNQGQCHPDGDGGLLRTTPAAGVQTGTICDALQLGNGERFIDWDTATHTSNTGDVDIAEAFGCIAAVGDSGCGFEAPLEAVYRVLTTPSVNPGFLRDDALLVVILMTDEDDCSAPPDSQLFDPSAVGVGQWGTLHSFRCTQWGIACDGKPLTGGALSGTTSCTPVAGGPLFDVSRYQQLFAAGGVKANADDLVLATFVAPSMPFGVDVTTPCADQVNTPSCAILGHSCVNPANAFFFGDPAVRINSVTATVPNAVTGSICDSDYSPTISAVADAMAARLGGTCLPGAVVDLADPGCTVAVAGVEAPRCQQGRLPCWDLVDDQSCAMHLTPAGAAQRLRLTVQGAPSNAAIDASCPLYEPTP